VPYVEPLSDARTPLADFVNSLLYNDPAMETTGAENIVIGVLASIGVVVLLVVFVYVVRQVLRKES
jgi:hypothetical protein